MCLRASWLLLPLAMAVGCGGAVAVRARVERPALVPLRVFPRVLVAATNADAVLLADLLAQDLGETGETDARRVEAWQLEPARAAGRIRPGTSVVLLSVRYASTVRTEWANGQAPPCTQLGCSAFPRSATFDVPVLTAHATLVVHDGPTGRVLQSREFEAQGEGMDPVRVRERTEDRLRAEIARAIDARIAEVVVGLLEVGEPEVHAAIEAIGEGDWARGRVLLEAFVAGPVHAALPPAQRARVLYDLAEARRFDADQDGAEARFALAERTLREALALDRQPLYVAALRALERDRRDASTTRAQRDAAHFNRTLVALPTPPAAYETPLPPAPSDPR